MVDITIKIRKIRTHLIIIAMACMLLTTACQQKDQKTQIQPNVVFILADDLGLTDLTSTGSKYYETPNIDRIAKEGMVFTQGYASSRVCSPSRASIMTGKSTARHGITDWIGAKSGVKWREHKRHDLLLPSNYVRSLLQEEITLAEAMHQAGYINFFAGKWHLGGKGDYPEDHGFDFNIGGWEKGSPMGGYFAPFDNPKLGSAENGENLSMKLAKETVNFMATHADKHKDNRKEKPFFVFLSFYAVHGPIQTTREKWHKYRAKAESNGLAEKGFHMERVLPIRHVQDNPVYAGLVESMDDAVGLVLNSLEELGLAENTVVIFTSDNGGVASGDSYSTSNLPYRGGKGYQWEGGIREPYFIKVPWLANQGKKSNVPVTGADFYPTILDLAGAKLMPDQHKDGISLLPILKLKSDTISPRSLYWHYPHYGNQGGSPSSIIRDGDWKLIHYWEDGHNELYNLATDIGEQQDLAASQPDMTKQLSEKLINWLTEMKAEIPKPDPEYNASLAQNRQQNIINDRWPELEQQRLDFLNPDWQPNEDWWGSQITVD